MPKNLYFVDSIYQPIGSGIIIVSLLPTTNNEENARIEVIQDGNLKMSNYKGRIQEGWYVFCDDNKQFSYGNTTAYAREAFNEFKRMLDITLNDYLTEEIREDVGFLNSLSNPQDVTITSYHINVHHGNCSVILLQSGGRYEIWMVDCSLSEKGKGNRFAGNLEAGFKEIRQQLGMQEGEDLHIKRFFLTHLHTDHYAGVEYLVNHGYIDNQTLCYWNFYYHMAGPKYLKTWQALINANVRFIEPVYGNGCGAFEFLHPECRIYRSKGTTGVKVKQSRVVGEVNNSSTVIKFSLGGKSMVFPGDLEQDGFKRMSGEIPCQGNLTGIDYYAVSHHGSLNGHPVVPCMSKNAPYLSPLCCVSQRVTRVVLMGRNGAYPGIYNSKVENYWKGLRGSLVYTEKAPHYVKLEWGSGKVTMR